MSAVQVVEGEGMAEQWVTVVSLMKGLIRSSVAEAAAVSSSRMGRAAGCRGPDLLMVSHPVGSSLPAIEIC